MKKFIIPKYIVFVGSLSACTATDHSNGVKVTENTISKFANNGHSVTFTKDGTDKIVAYTYADDSKIDIDDTNLPQEIRKFSDLNTLSKFLDTVFVKITTNDHQEPVLNTYGKLMGGFVEDKISYDYLKKLTLSELKSRKMVLDDRKKEFENELAKLEELRKSYGEVIENISPFIEQRSNNFLDNFLDKLNKFSIGLPTVRPLINLSCTIYDNIKEKKDQNPIVDDIASYDEERKRINSEIEKVEEEIDAIISLISKY